jgi:predicted metal-dependent phosphoesterase TrpH
MNDQFVDLHSHSTASDGTFAPADVVRLARDSGLVGLALTDHDTIAGLPEAAAAAKELGIDFLPGIEISCEVPKPATMHMLGYGVDIDSRPLKELTSQLMAGRDDRNPRIIRRLNELNVAITMDEVEQQAGGDVVGRPHIAAVMMKKGYVSSIKQAFDKYLATGGLAYFDRDRPTPKRGIELIRQAGGLPVLAHPVQLRSENDAQLERTVKDLADLGLAGIEVIHSDHDAAMYERCTKFAERFGLLKTGGSDFHGTNKKDIRLGVANGRRVPKEFLDRIREQLNRPQQQKQQTSHEHHPAG